MAERRLPLSVTDDEGIEHAGEVLIASVWRPDLAPSPDAEFVIVLIEQPSESEPAVDDPRTVVCLPAAAVTLPKVAAEAGVAYGNGGALVRLPRRAAELFARGRLLAAHPISITASDIFNGSAARLDMLARERLAGARRAERYWRALDEALSLPRKPATGVRPDQLRGRLRKLLSKASVEGLAAEAIERLRVLVHSSASPERLWEAPGALVEDAALLRCLHECPGEAAELAPMRGYLDNAAVPDRSRQLRFDALATREQLSFVTLLSEPRRIESMRALFETFRSAYAATYMKHHQWHQLAASKVRRTLDEIAPTVAALHRLNTIRALGTPVGSRDLPTYERFLQEAEPCAEADIASALAESPRCPGCGIGLADMPAAEEVDLLRRRLQTALERQQSRLAGETVRRILSRGGERLEQFISIVQAADQAGLVQVLDDELLLFIRDLLEQPTAPTPEAAGLIEELALAYPTIGPGDIDDAVEAFRKMLAERLLAQRNGTDGASIRLAAKRRNGP